MAPPAKRRKTGQLEELNFDLDARQEYLTGFHKRKVQRTKHAQEQAAKLEREEKVKQRKELRDQRKVDLERHVAEVNAMLRKANPDISDSSDNDDNEEEEWNGIASPPRPSIDGVDEYVDEDKYTTVTIETMEDAKAFLKDEDEDTDKKVYEKEEKEEKKRGWQKRNADAKAKPKKKKFRYETKVERKENRIKQKSKNAAAAKARKSRS